MLYFEYTNSMENTDLNEKKSSETIQKRIVMITVTCLTVMCLIISIVSFFVFRQYLVSSMTQSSKASLKLLSDSIDTNISSINRMVRFCCTNSSIAEYIEQNPNPGSVLSVATYDRISEEYANNPANNYMPRLAVITNEHFLQVVTATYSSTSNLAKEVPALEGFKDLLGSPGYDFSNGFIKDPFYRNGIQVLFIIRPITYQFNSVQGGFLFMEVSSNLFTDAFKRYAHASDSNLYLTVGNHIYIYENGSLIETDSIPSGAVSQNLSFNGISISQSMSTSEIFGEGTLLFLVLVFILICIIAICIVMMYILNKMISEPVISLRNRMERISDGDFTRDSSIEWEHELGDIGRGINDLAENVNNLMNKRLEDEKQKRDLEYKVLQSQINPHFIYNTLNSIKWMATIQGSEGISEMTTALAKLLKSISKGTGNLVTIEEELSLLNDYFTIQSYRYGGTIAMDVDCDESVKQCGILKFTLQPIVENAIFHGLEPKGSGTIDIKISRLDEDILISVRDDGVGMSSEKAIMILTEDAPGKSDFFRELGVKNVHNRLKYEFGEKYGITIDSVEGSYTVMNICIPCVETN